MSITQGLSHVIDPKFLCGPAALDDFASTAAMLRRVRAEGQLCFIGNGGSAAIASHMAADFFNKGQFETRSFTDLSMLTCLSNDYGYVGAFNRQVARTMKKSDALIAISSSGESDNIIQAAKTAMAAAAVITLTGFSPNNRLRALGTYNFYVPAADYGIVETAHLGLLHALLNKVGTVGT